MKKLKSYSDYSNFDQHWLGSLPSHWKIIRTKLLFDLITEPAPVGNNEQLLSVYTAIGVKPRKDLEARGNKASSTDNYWKVKKGDIIVNKLLAWMGAIGISEYDGVTSPAYDILRAKKNVNAYYYNYLFRNVIASREFKRHSRGIMDMRLRLYFSRFGDVKLSFPPIDEQNKIVDYLQFKNEKINRFIKKKKQLIKLLKEQKAAIINQAVTKGLDENVPMKDSGIEWLGEIPEHWEVKPLKYFVTTNDEALSNNVDKDYNLKYIDIGNVNSDGVINEIVNYKFKDAPSRARRIVKSGDVIISTVRTYLKAIAKIENDEDLIVSTGFAVLRPKSIIISDFLNLAIRANYFIETICANSFGVSYPSINSSKLVTLKLSVPSALKEQEAIVNFIENETFLIDKTIFTIQKEITLVEEYKTALIAEAVTGKIDVRDFKVPTEETPLAMVAEEAAHYNK